jgi:hypothetical protein
VSQTLDHPYTHRFDSRRQSVATLGDLEFNGVDSTIVIFRIQIVTVLEHGDVVGHDDGAHICIGVLRPDHCRALSVVDIETLEPGFLLGGKGAVVDFGCQIGRPGLGIREFATADEFFWDGG